MPAFAVIVRFPSCSVREFVNPPRRASAANAKIEMLNSGTLALDNALFRGVKERRPRWSSPLRSKTKLPSQSSSNSTVVRNNLV